jgi:hypothetical protein
MKLCAWAFLSAFLVSPANCFQPSSRHYYGSLSKKQLGPERPLKWTHLKSSPLSDEELKKAKRMREILNEEARDPVNMAESAKQMKSMKPEDLTRMMQEMENMNPMQLSALKAMGMQPDMMKKTMELMRENPNMMASAQKLMETMSPEELLQQSRLAQEQMANMKPEDMEQNAKVLSGISSEQIEAAVEVFKETAAIKEGGNDPVEMETGPGSSADKDVMDAMFRVAEFMSQPPSGSVTFQGFSTLPPIMLLSGDREFDISLKELKECWAGGSLGNTRVDRTGFERVWKEVQEYFEDDIMGESRKEAKKRSVSSKSEKASDVIPEVVSSSTTAQPETATVGQNLDPDQIKAVNERVKNMSEDDVETMLADMANMDDAQKERMKKMGVDPAMMQKTVAMMKDNPFMRKAAQSMVKNMSSEQMMDASRQAQQQMAGMSKEDIKKAMDQFGKGQ